VSENTAGGAAHIAGAPEALEDRRVHPPGGTAEGRSGKLMEGLAQAKEQITVQNCANLWNELNFNVILTIIEKTEGFLQVWERAREYL
jgi:hypothetical protein